MRNKSPETGLTEFESHLLSLIWRNQPTTAYQVRQGFAQSPTRSAALSQGSVYPAVERLKSRGYVRSVPTEDRRKTEQLSCTAAGEKVLKDWLFRLPSHLPEDPLRSRVIALALLGAKERADWVKSAKTALLEDLAKVDEFAADYRSALYELAHDNARSALLARIRWLERVESKLDSID